MALSKKDISDILSDIAVLLELKGDSNPFKVRAYQSGARIIDALDDERFEQLVAANELGTVPGLGEALVSKIGELKATGKLVFFDTLKASIEPGLVEMLQIPGLGPKKIKTIHLKLGVTTIERLKEVCDQGLVAELAGFGEKSQQKIIEGIKNREAYSKRHWWWDASVIAEPIVQGLRALPGVKRAEAAGSLRRSLETVGDLDFIAASDEPGPIVAWFTTLPGVKEVTAQGETKASVRFESGLQADLRIVPDAQFVFALHHFTGSKDHNVQMRQRALARGMSLSEWGITAVEGENQAKLQKTIPSSVRDEKALFAVLELNYIPPELREGMGEIDAAEKGELPDLIQLSDIRGVFHNHTTASDGHNTLSEMAKAAEALGLEYFGIADHSKSSFQANGLHVDRLLEQIEAIRAFNKSGQSKCHVFSGSECDILADGDLDFDDSILAELDYVVASVHSSLTQEEDIATKRTIKALENLYVTMLGHPSGRLLLKREASKINLSKVIDAAIANDVIIELNADPRRLDLDWRFWRKAADKGLKCSINPDAHQTETLTYVKNGVGIARKGWLTKHHVINTLGLADVKNVLLKKKASASKRK
jgi:DNA polymerase (family 10)